MKILSKYTNGVGHLIMSILMCLIAIVLIVLPGTDAATKAVGLGLLPMIGGSWFVTGAAKSVAHQVELKTQPLRADSFTMQGDKTQIPNITRTFDQTPAQDQAPSQDQAPLYKEKQSQ